MKTPKNVVAIAVWLGLATLAGILVLIIIDYFTAAELQVDLKRPRFRLVRHRMILADQAFEMDWTQITSSEFTPDEGPPIFAQPVRGGRYSWVIMEPLGGMRLEEVLEYPEDYVVYQMDTSRMFKPTYKLRPADAWATNH
jgi:hypothetical protein